ncbi:MAG: type I methionyl aminopeptidase [Patescibacteria group bacterium]|nr:type I methionyl aminopeptidase [Patescibacteria group bacterium]
MIKLKSQQEIGVLKQGGHILAQILRELEKFTKENYKNDDFTTLSIEAKTEELLNSYSVKSSFRGYSPGNGIKPFPANLCVSINDEVVHGIPEDEKLAEGDIVSLDLGIIYKNLYTDAAISFILGEGMPEDKKLIEITEQALQKGIEKAVLGNTIGDIGNAIEQYVLGNNLELVRNYCGHGVGYAVHEEPSVPNCGKAGEGVKLQEGMVIAIEPMVVLGSGKVFVADNDWTVKTADGGRAAHFEHTIAVTRSGPMVLTK